MNKPFLYFISSALFISAAFATGATKTTPPDPEGTMFINNGILGTDKKTGKKTSNTEGLKTDRILGNDNLPEKEVETGTRVNRNLGKQDTTSVIDESGNVATLKKGSTEINEKNAAGYKTDKEKEDGEKSYNEWRNNFDTYLNSTGTKEHEDKEAEYKAKQKEEIKKQDISVRSLMDQTINSRDITSGSMQIKNMFETEDVNQKDPLLKELDHNASQVYKDGGYEPKKADTGVLLKKNVGALKEAYNQLPDLQKQLTEKTKMPIIKCQISRNLLPAYYCPIKGKDGFRFPGNLPSSVIQDAAKTAISTDANGKTTEGLVNPAAAALVNLSPSLRRVNLNAAKDTCNQYCKSTSGDFKCVKKKMIDKAEIDISTQEITLFPSYDTNSASFTLTTKEIIPIKNVSFKISVIRTKQDSTLTEEDWLEFLQKSFIRFRYSIMEIPDDKNLAPITIADRVMITADKETAVFTIPVNRQMTKLQVKFWKPYVSDNPFMKKEFDYIFDDFIKKFGGEIKISEIKANHVSDSFFYCPIRQLVASKRECGGLDSTELNYGSGKDMNTMYLCDSNKYKIGPESTTGAFFDEESCEQSCYIKEECITTYDHYQGAYGAQAIMYKAEVDCVDDETNTQCTKQKCEAFFRDVNLRPLNEVVVQNDNTIVYTVKNRALTENIRPKIDIEKELGANLNDPEQLKSMFNAEQKDGAYLYMTKNLTMNMIKYPVGTPSPHNMSYIMKRGATPNSGYGFAVDIKPGSYDFEIPRYLYMIARLDQRYHARYGSYYIKSNPDRAQVQTKNSKVQFKDYTYLIKKPDDKWEVFRKEEFAEYWQEKVINVINSEGKIERKMISEWVIQPDDGLIPAYFGKYDATTNTFKTFDSSELAHSFKTDTFQLSDNVYRYTITKDHIEDIYDAPGSLIHDQAPKDNESNLEKKYLGGIHPYWSGHMSNYAFYFIYSDKQLTYDELMKKIEGEKYAINTQKVPSYKNEWGVFDYISNGSFNSNGVRHDGQLNNNIAPFIIGKPNNSAVLTEWEPSLSEHGKKVFKFLFLYDDKTINPFERKDQKPDGYVTPTQP